MITGGTVRGELAVARSRLRYEGDRLVEATALAEQRAIEAAGEAGYGKNERDRERYLTLALVEDADFRSVRATYRECQRGVDELQARLDCQHDVDRERRLSAMERIADMDASGSLVFELGGLGSS